MIGKEDDKDADVEHNAFKSAISASVTRNPVLTLIGIGYDAWVNL